MILFADSGSTKTDWILADPKTGERKAFDSIGFNPVIQTEDFIRSEIWKNWELMSYAAKVNRVYFYGAGCSSEERNLIMENALRTHFPDAKISVDHDLNGAVIALCQGESGIACILGTGSNSVLFDGKKQIKKVPSLGYILGDEASGAYFGKRLAKDFMYKKLPSEIARYMSDDLKLDKEDLLNKVYKEPNPNRFLASFAIVLSQFLNTEYVQDLLDNGFREFFGIHIACFDNYQNYPVHFIGSIALNFKNNLEKIANEFGVKTGRFVQKPVNLIADYYLKK